VFGLPDAEKSEHHLHGHVGEWLWHLLTRDNHAVRVQPDPKGDVTDGGGDGLSMGKKNTGSGSLSTSLNHAYTQLAEAGCLLTHTRMARSQSWPRKGLDDRRATHVHHNGYHTLQSPLSAARCSK
jgi:hypothetical protein